MYILCHQMESDVYVFMHICLCMYTMQLFSISDFFKELNPGQ